MVVERTNREVTVEEDQMVVVFASRGRAESQRPRRPSADVL